MFSFRTSRLLLLLMQRGQFVKATMASNGSMICLFDVDGTVTSPRQKITREMDELLQELRKKAAVGLVGGSDISKIAEQIGGMEETKKYDYIFSENGIVSFKKGAPFHRQNIANFVGEEDLQRFINYTLHCLSEITLPLKRGTFIEFRIGMINISPVGRNCSQAERDAFEKYDKEHHIRTKLIERLKSQFPELGFVYSIGGQISFDVVPKGWDKTYSLHLIQEEGYKTIHFFGDKTFLGGNDFEIFNDPRTIGHSVSNPNNTIELIKKLFFS